MRMTTDAGPRPLTSDMQAADFRANHLHAADPLPEAPSTHGQDVVEEIANAVTHGIGALLSAVGLGVLVTMAWLRGGPGEMAALVIYGVTLVLLYLASTFYHSARNAKLKAFFHRADHACIFLLIAGTYTPFTLLVLGGGWGWVLCVTVWALALLGVAFKIAVDPSKHGRLSVGLYLGLGWLGVLAMGPIIASMEPAGIALLVAGGLAYTAGVPFYMQKRLRYAHAVWHLFVLAGSAFHFAAIAAYALPAAA